MSQKQLRDRRLAIAGFLLVMAGLIYIFAWPKAPRTPADSLNDLAHALRTGTTPDKFQVVHQGREITGSQKEGLFKQVIGPYFSKWHWISTRTETRTSEQATLDVAFEDSDRRRRTFKTSAQLADEGGGTTYEALLYSVWFLEAPSIVAEGMVSPGDQLAAMLAGAERDGRTLEQLGLPPPGGPSHIRSWAGYREYIAEEISKRDQAKRETVPR